MIKFLDRLESNQKLTPYGIVALRAVLACYWLLHWSYKVFFQGMGATQELFVKLGYPVIFAWGDVTIELLVIISLVLGLYVRTFSILILINLIPAVEIWIPHGIWAFKGGYEFMLLWIFLQLVLALLGPGPCSLKTLSFKTKIHKP